MTERFASSDVHAYIDACLNAADRREFEAKLHDDAELRRRVEIWHAQNEAIRLAYGAAGRPRGGLALGRPSNENLSQRPGAETAPRRFGVLDGPSPAQKSGRVETLRIERAPVEAPRRAIGFWRGIAIVTLSLAMLCVSAWGGPEDPRDRLMDAGISALRAFSSASAAPLDLSTRDAVALKKWLAPRFSTAPSLGTLEIPGWTLIGVRIVPGTAAAAALILFENPLHARAGLLVERLDAPPTLEPVARKAGETEAAAQTLGGYGLAAMAPSLGMVAALLRTRPEP